MTVLNFIFSKFPIFPNEVFKSLIYLKTFLLSSIAHLEMLLIAPRAKITKKADNKIGSSLFDLWHIVRFLKLNGHTAPCFVRRWHVTTIPYHVEARFDVSTPQVLWNFGAHSRIHTYKRIHTNTHIRFRGVQSETMDVKMCFCVFSLTGIHCLRYGKMYMDT